MKNFIPSLHWLSRYDKSMLKGDLSAGLTVGVMLIPQGMAYALIAGLPPIYGLYASTIPLIIYAVLGTSRQLAVGPVAMVSLLTAAGVGILAESGTNEYISLAITLAFLVGSIQFILGVFRLGFLINFLSHPVISGFTSAAALIIGLSQLKHLLGVDIQRSHYIHEILIQAINQYDQINGITLLIGTVGILLIIFLKKIHKSIPGALIIVILGIITVSIFSLIDQGIQVVGDIPRGMPSFTMPDLSWSNVKQLLPVALAISLVSFMESIAVAKSIQSKHKNYKIVPNQELIALGMANIGGSFFQSFTTTGGFSRTAINDQAGAKSGMASLFSASLIILTLLFLTPLFHNIPKALLASVIMVAVFGLIDFKEAKHLWFSDRNDFWILMVTFIATLSLGIEPGIAVGVVISLGMILFKTAYPHHAELGRIANSSHYRNIERYKNLKTWPGILIIRFDAQLYFANITYFRNIVNDYIREKEKDLDTIIFNFESINNIDSSAIHILEEISESASNENIRLLFSGVKGPVMDKFKLSGFVKKIGGNNFFMDVDEAVQASQ